MATNYNFTSGNNTFAFDDIFIPNDVFTQGGLWTWGNNAYGQLGVNDTTARCTPVTTFIGSFNWKQVSCGNQHTIAVKTDGTLWAWGKNGSGQLGLGDKTDRVTPVQVSTTINYWKQVSCGSAGNLISAPSTHSAAVRNDGTLWTWGYNGYAQLGNNTSVDTCTPIVVSGGATNWKQVACGYNHMAAIKTDGTLWGWGKNSSGQLGTNDVITKSTPVQTSLGGNTWKQVSCGNLYTAAIKNDGTLWAWGYNFYGQLGTNDTTTRSTPVTTFIGGTNWKQVSCGGSYMAAVKTDGTLWLWGSNTYGYLGTNTSNLTSTPTTTYVGGTNWKQVDCGYNSTAAIKTDGTLWTWGYNGYGQLGSNDATDRLTPITTFIGGTNWKQVSIGDKHSSAVYYNNYYQ
jgi:YD repeat-containing protein